ncbi:MAG: hypothetical protein FJX76_20460 [Armatimonadetes bacterium]|nr:hypothetical protein [Armatimonadota bacterium]
MSLFLHGSRIVDLPSQNVNAAAAARTPSAEAPPAVHPGDTGRAIIAMGRGPADPDSGGLIASPR